MTAPSFCVDMLLDIVYAEGPLAPAKLALVRKLCASLGVDERQLAALAAMRGYSYVAPEDWRHYQRAQDDARGPQATRTVSGKDPYAVLGLDAQRAATPRSSARIAN